MVRGTVKCLDIFNTQILGLLLTHPCPDYLGNINISRIILNIFWKGVLLIRCSIPRGMLRKFFQFCFLKFCIIFYFIICFWDKCGYADRKAEEAV